MKTRFRVGVTRDVLDSRGEPSFGRKALDILEREGAIDWEYLPEVVREITPDHAARYDAIYVNMARTPAAAVARSDCRLRVVARHGVGYDSVDVPAMTRAGVLVTNTPAAMPRPVATIALTFVLALAGKLMTKDRLTRTGRWDERMDNMGMGLTGRTLGVVGAGRIGKEILRMARVFDLKLLAVDPNVNDVELAYVGARKVDHETLYAESDFVVAIPLLDETTRHLVGAAAFARMKPTAYFINVSRGPVVDEAALIDALRAKRIAGAALDVFEQEPVDPANPLLAMDNVIVTPHSLCWTDECFHNMASIGLKSIVDTLSGRAPEFVVDRDVLKHPRVAAWLRVIRIAVALLAALPVVAGAFDLQGHRGTRGLAPENTLAAFKRALDLGVTTLETDMGVTKDGVVVISHEPALYPPLVRLDGAWLREPGPPIRSLTLAELSRYDIGRTDPSTPYGRNFPEQQAADGERFPTLDQVLALAKAAGVRVNLETKITPTSGATVADPESFAKLVVDRVAAAGMERRATVQSFDWRTLAAVRRLNPAIETVCLTNEGGANDTVAPRDGVPSPWFGGLKLDDYRGSLPALVAAAGCAAWSPNFQALTRERFADAKARGLRVVPWTVNQPADMARLVDWGVDGLITDYPDRARKVLADKGVALR